MAPPGQRSPVSQNRNLRSLMRPIHVVRLVCAEWATSASPVTSESGTRNAADKSRHQELRRSDAMSGELPARTARSLRETSVSARVLNRPVTNLSDLVTELLHRRSVPGCDCPATPVRSAWYCGIKDWCAASAPPPVSFFQLVIWFHAEMRRLFPINW